MDDIDRESFKARFYPFDNKGHSVEMSSEKIIHQSGLSDIILDGEWLLVEGGDEKNRIHNTWINSVKAKVPGSIHTALWNAEIIPDPYFGQNDSIAEKQSYKTWWYKKEFSISDKIKNPILHFGGIANKCSIWLNNVKLGDHEGMFGEISFDVSNLLKEKNTLIIKLEPIPQVFEPEGTFFGGANKSWQNTVVFNCVYGWHYSQIPSLGIWRSVKIINQAAVEIENPFITTRSIDGKMSLHLTLRKNSDKLDGILKLSIAPENFEGKEQSFEYKVSSHLENKILNFDFNISDPQLWWPNGKGKQNLYKAMMSFVPINGESADYKELSFGIRTIRMAPHPKGPSPDKYNWTFVINNKPMFVKGSGWCTMDPLMNFSKQRYDRFLSVAKQQHIQMLRAWGGGIPETDDFYDLCDRYGIMIIQEWPTAWDSHNTQPYDMLEETVRHNILRIRNHPSLVMYGGGNESSNPFGKAIDMMGRYSIELDGTRPFHRGEAWGGSDHNYNCWWDDAHLNHNLNMTSLFWGEFGIASLPQKESVIRYIGKEEQNIWPPIKNSNFLHHMPIFGQVGEMDKLKQYSGYFMPDDNMDYFIAGSQLAQVVAVRHTLERARTRWPESTGALYYKLNDNYPAVSWSCIDWYGAIKPLHYFVQNSFEPLAAVVLFNQTNLTGNDADLPIFLLDDNLNLKGKNWEVKISCYNEKLECIGMQSFFGESKQKEVTQLGTFKLDKEKTKAKALLFVSDIVSETKTLFRTFYFMNFEVRKGSLYNLPRTTLETKRTGNSLVITNTGTYPAVGVNIICPGYESNLSVSQNFFWLNPMESKTVEVNIDQPVITNCWNKEGNPFIK
ncbi:glycoside hydrolase family 2 TIM barrel-domain containing protein [Prevotella sp. 10(H)]|uniref:glycoside hydrolase family 2 protein n=1 Tax=Prevotella sp. 10(H) TaxID=1158294 RepID=UPI001E5F99E8|nr:glycoside hydrolase family 2 TIM barrel-domain containing protein [Prevotella sp. 10(H)]